MKATRRTRISGALGLCLLSVLLVPLVLARAPQPRRPLPARRRPPSVALSPSAAARREAQGLWGQALRAVKPALEAQLEANPEAVEADIQDVWRRQLMVRDPHGHLRRAREAARRAVALARSREEIYQATHVLALMECESGFHEAELPLARRLVEMQPWNALSQSSLGRAARCNGLEAQVRQAQVALDVLEELQEKPGPSAPVPPEAQPSPILVGTGEGRWQRQ